MNKILSGQTAGFVAVPPKPVIFNLLNSMLTAMRDHLDVRVARSKANITLIVLLWDQAITSSAPLLKAEYTVFCRGVMERLTKTAGAHVNDRTVSAVRLLAGLVQHQVAAV